MILWLVIFATSFGVLNTTAYVMIVRDDMDIRDDRIENEKEWNQIVSLYQQNNEISWEPEKDINTKWVSISEVKALKKEIQKRKKLQKTLLETYNTFFDKAVFEQITQNGIILDKIKTQYQMLQQKDIVI